MSTNKCKFCTAGRAHLDCPNGYAPTTLEELERSIILKIEAEVFDIVRLADKGDDKAYGRAAARFVTSMPELLSHYRAGIAQMARELQSPETPNSFSEGWNAALDALADKLIDKS